MYDPYKAKSLSEHEPAAASYWQSTTSSIEFDALTENTTNDVTIIGAGYTGLSCAIHLAKLGISNVSVVDANHIGWGCSSRNAGFVLPGTGRLGYADLVSRFGMQNTQRLHNDYMQAIELIDQLSLEAGSEIDKTEYGYLKLAHSKNWYQKLKRTAEYLDKEFGYEVELIDKSRLSAEFVDHQKVYGAIRYTNGFGLNPLKLVNSYANYAKSLGVKLYSNSSVQQIETGRSGHKVITNSGSILSDKVVIATNGYTPKGLNTPLQGKILPVLTSVIVTRPLTEQELLACNFKTQQVMMDTRELKYYYRLLPDNRILFGGRGGVTGNDADTPKYPNRLLAELKSSFRGLEQVTIDYKWSGWISVSFDQMPHIHRTEDNIFYATGYCGSGVSFTALAGKQLADMIAEKECNSPLMSPLPSFPFAPLRRTGQRMFYQYGRLKDWLG